MHRLVAYVTGISKATKLGRGCGKYLVAVSDALDVTCCQLSSPPDSLVSAPDSLVSATDSLVSAPDSLVSATDSLVSSTERLAVIWD
jgi:hypothetical protein